MQQGMRGKCRGRRKQKDVVIMRVEHCGDRKKGIATRTVLNDDRLAPFRREFIGQQPRRDVDPRTGAQRNNETDRALRPLTPMSAPAQSARAKIAAVRHMKTLNKMRRSCIITSRNLTWNRARISRGGVITS